MRIARRRHDLIPIAIADPREIELPNVRFIEFVDNESGELVTVDTSSADFREAFHRGAMEDVVRRRLVFRRMGTDSIELTTGESFVEPLTKFLRAREARK
jgi:hypothetical protein